jgi:hypothetical protein
LVQICHECTLLSKSSHGFLLQVLNGAFDGYHGNRGPGVPEPLKTLLTVVFVENVKQFVACLEPFDQEGSMTL